MPRSTLVSPSARRLSAGVLVASLLIPVTATAPVHAVTSPETQNQSMTTEAADSQAPALSSVTRTSPDVVGPGESVRLQWSSEATDIRYVAATFINETGQTLSGYVYGNEDLVITFDPEKTTPGTYRLQNFNLVDHTDTTTYYLGDGTVQTTPSAVTPPPATDLNLDALTFTIQKPFHNVTPNAVVFTDEDGTAADTYSIPVTDGVEYLVDGKVVAAGSYLGSGTVTVSARATAGYVLADGVATNWSGTFDTTATATPAAPVFADKPSTYALPTITGVQYYVNGTATAPGTYKANGTGTVEITARPQDGYVFAEDATTSWTTTFKTSPTHVTPDAVIFIDEPGTASDTYTIPATEGVDYLVDGTITAPGTYPGTGSVKIKAKGQVGYVANGPTTWKTTFKR